MSESAVRTPKASAARPWRLRPWPNDPAARLLVLTDHALVPSAAEFAQAIEAARRDGVAVLRTTALFPRSATVAEQVGFRPIDRLALLRIRLDAQFDHRFESRHGAVLPSTRPLRPWQLARAAVVDQEAFGPIWGNDAASLGDIRSATPGYRARWAGRPRQVDGFAISGASAEAGYLQRVAVHPDARRQGYASALVIDALAWMRRRQLGVAYVNTGLENHPAQALYQGLGFATMDEVLTIAEFTLPA